MGLWGCKIVFQPILTLKVSTRNIRLIEFVLSHVAPITLLYDKAEEKVHVKHHGFCHVNAIALELCLKQQKSFSTESKEKH